MTKNTEREEILAALKTSVAGVIFEKKDGTIRQMRATLHESFLPEQTTSETKKATNDEVIACWDLDKQAWRSFRIDSIVDIDYQPV